LVRKNGDYWNCIILANKKVPSLSLEVLPVKVALVRAVRGEGTVMEAVNVNFVVGEYWHGIIEPALILLNKCEVEEGG
jgi:3'-phosphoadenosine 5'-phosphosulfate (PAPS) 3'-phosphatase